MGKGDIVWNDVGGWGGVQLREVFAMVEDCGYCTVFMNDWSSQ